MKNRPYRMIIAGIFTSIVVALGLGACGGSTAVGSPCTQEGDASECASGYLCAKETSGQLYCLLICVDQADCPDGTNCNGAKSDQKVCEPNDG